jgi:excisionase family DNA binding protein
MSVATPAPEGGTLLVTVTEAAALLGYSRQTIWRLTKSDLAFPKPKRSPGGSPRFSRELLREWANAQPEAGGEAA